MLLSILYTIMYILPSIVMLNDLKKLKYNFKWLYFLRLITFQYLNTEIFLLNMGEELSFFNSVFLIISFFIAIIYMIYSLIVNNTITSIITSFVFIFILTIIILLFCTGIVTKGTTACLVIAFFIYLIYMLILEIALKKINKQINRLLYIIYILILGFVGVIILTIAYMNPTELTLESITDALIAYGQLSKNGTNNLHNLILFLIAVIFNFIIFAPLKDSVSDILKNFLSK